MDSATPQNSIPRRDASLRSVTAPHLDAHLGLPGLKSLRMTNVAPRSLKLPAMHLLNSFRRQKYVPALLGMKPTLFEPCILFRQLFKALPGFGVMAFGTSGLKSSMILNIDSKPLTASSNNFAALEMLPEHRLMGCLDLLVGSSTSI